MEKINVAELLKDCPKGMELDCTMYENITFEEVVGTIDCDGNEDVNIILLTHYNDGTDDAITLTNYGTYTYNETAKCVIFPKGKTTWEGFTPPCKFKDGDIVISDMGDIHLLRTKDSSCCAYRKGKRILPEFDSTLTTNVTIVRLATEEEKQKLFNVIKANGYKWNTETKTLEKLVEPKFKVGDMIQDVDKYKVKITEVNIEDECYEYESMIAKGIGSIPFREQDEWELVPNKFDISNLKPFESRVLVRDYDHQCWRVSFFGYFDKFMGKFDTVRGVYIQCIPYEGNEHLLNTNKDCDEFYKNW